MEIYTDGSYRPMQNEITFGFVVVEHEKITHEFKDGKKLATKQREKKYSATYAELKAIMMAVDHAKKLNEFVTIYSDFKSVNSMIYKTKKHKFDFINDFKSYMKSNKDLYEIKFVKGHKTNKFNNHVDEMCRNNLSIIEKKVGNKTLLYNVDLFKKEEINPNKYKEHISDEKFKTKRPIDTEAYILLKSLTIPFGMLYNSPKENKKNNKFNIYKENNGIIKALKVEKRGSKFVLADGYISYLWLRENGETWIPVKIKK